MKWLVCGGRNYANEWFAFMYLDRLRQEYWPEPVTHVIHGNARGADLLADAWADARGIQPVACRALWKFHGKAGGSIRNGAMLPLQPDLVIAFPGGNGTADMVKQARRAGVEVHEVVIA